MQTAHPSQSSGLPGLCAISSESSPTAEGRASSGNPQVSRDPIGPAWLRKVMLVDQYGSTFECPMIKCLTYKALRDSMLEGFKNSEICDFILYNEFFLEDTEKRIIPSYAWEALIKKRMQRGESGHVITIVKSTPLFTLMFEGHRCVDLPVSSCCSSKGMRATIIDALKWCKGAANTIEAVEQDCYYLKGKNGAISPGSYCHLRGMTANLITWGGFASPTPAPTPVPSQEKLNWGSEEDGELISKGDVELEEDGELVSKGNV